MRGEKKPFNNDHETKDRKKKKRKLSADKHNAKPQTHRPVKIPMILSSRPLVSFCASATVRALNKTMQIISFLKKFESRMQKRHKNEFFKFDINKKSHNEMN